MVDHHRHAPGNRLVVRPDGPVLSVRAATSRTAMGLGDAGVSGRARLVVVRTPGQLPVPAAADLMGAGVCRLWLQPLPEPAHDPRGVGHRAGVPTPAPTPERRRPGADAAGVHAAAAGAPAFAAEDSSGPDSPRLLNQPLTSEASRDSIKAVLDAPPFKNPETVIRYRFGEETAESPRPRPRRNRTGSRPCSNGSAANASTSPPH